MRDSALYPIVFMVAVSAVFGAAVSAVQVATRDRVEAGERSRVRGHVLKAFGLDAPADPRELDRVWAASVEEARGAGGPYYVARRAGVEVYAYAFPFTGPGFWGPISGVVAVDPAGRRLLGISFTRHSETPGLGGRISEPWFQEQFRGKALEATAGSPPLRFVYRKPEAPDEVQAITGATQTSSRLARYLIPFLQELRTNPVLSGRGGKG